MKNIVYAVLITIIVTAWTVFIAQKWRYEAKMAITEAEHAQTLKGISDEATRKVNESLQKLTEANARLAANDQRFTEELKNANRENDTLRDAVESGEQRLRIKATCTPASGNNVPRATSSNSASDAGTVELDPAVGRAVFNLRAALIRDTTALRECQQYVRTVQEMYKGEAQK